MVQNDVDIHTEFVFNCNWILIQLQLNTNSVEYSNCIQLQRICIQWQKLEGSTEYIFSWNWIRIQLQLKMKNHISSMHLGRIQLQLNMYSVATEYVFSCLLGSYSVAFLGRIQLQLNTYSAAAASNCFIIDMFIAHPIWSRVYRFIWTRE